MGQRRADSSAIAAEGLKAGVWPRLQTLRRGFVRLCFGRCSGEPRLLGNTTAYSFIEDPLVPRFEVPPRFTVMDAHCALCARGARWIAKNDRDMLFRIVPAHTALGEALLRHYGMDPADPTTWLYVEDGCAYSALDALVRVGCALGGVWRALAVLRILPPRWQDALYGAVARRRIQLFGSADLCALPDAQVQRRLLL